MKKALILLSLLSFMMPAVSWAEDDSCSKPASYTVDKRCYITDTQKDKKPYNATVAVVIEDVGYCTGTIVKDRDNGKLYLYTAKHCVVDDHNKAYTKINIILHDGRTIEVNKNKSGNMLSDIVYNQDWATYRVPDEYGDIDFTEISGNYKKGFGPFASVYDARVVGFGAMKVMSDDDINEFKAKYLDYLAEEEEKDEKEIERLEKRVMKKNRGIKLASGDGKNFFNYLQEEEPWYVAELYSDNANLKESRCRYTSSGIGKDCQGWGGNSGGGIFDNEGNIMGLITRGLVIVGGKRHGSIGGIVGTINLMQKESPFINHSK